MRSNPIVTTIKFIKNLKTMSNIEEKPGVMEIKETFKGTFYTSICCVIFCVILLVITTIVVLDIVGPSGIGVILIVVFWILIVGLMIYIGLKMRGGSKVRIFAIDDEKITFETPNKPTFKINASDFNTLEVSRVSRKDILDVALDLNFRHSRTINYRFHFLEAAKSYIVESQRDYSKKALKKIRTALEQFCLERGKTYILRLITINN